MNDEERVKLAKEIVKQMFAYIDLSLGKSLRTKIVKVGIVLMFLMAVFFGLIDIGKLFS